MLNKKNITFNQNRIHLFQLNKREDLSLDHLFLKVLKSAAPNLGAVYGAGTVLHKEFGNLKQFHCLLSGYGRFPDVQ